ncbi:aspartyl-phosphate phosphatase Spo0E family protein [Bacillus sp. OTU530]|uniref:aspartyl-phosphate phosphatase Spo0E family protein n=1 Tax=Bacillus sp. OTU530 TaxID=3043862 RepID=UPI00313D60AC
MQEKIEKKRQQLFYLTKLYGLTHPQTIQCSQQLDILINISMKKQGAKIKLRTTM